MSKSARSESARDQRKGNVRDLLGSLLQGSGAAREEPDGATGSAGASPSPRPGEHPAAVPAAERRGRRADVFDLDPRRILEQGPYIRDWDLDGEDFERLVAAVAERKQIDTPIWVRSTGPTGGRRFILLAGRGRLKAALRNDLAVVPVRDFGDISDREALVLQGAENLHRRDQTPGETAYTFWLLRKEGFSGVEIARQYTQKESYVSYMTKVGEALDRFPPHERLALSRPGVLQVRQCQAIAPLKTPEERVEALRAVLAGASSAGDTDPQLAYRRPDADAPAEEAEPGAPRPVAPLERARARRALVDEAPFHGRATRTGRTFRMRWERDQLARDPVAMAEGFVAAVRGEGAQLLAALHALEGAGPGGGRKGEAAVARARAALEALLARP
jgi:ParB-like chromosome segregation protein Spo0J